uniref:Uncharacterized protein n=1 Tax=Pyxicephalus adspersus TaxID=30357 RepID=A0AAV2ZNW1_PYXAD|nr:TPA: hypothetical protein GDO54_015706 [Pyxicephalus adspersus]
MKHKHNLTELYPDSKQSVIFTRTEQKTNNRLPWILKSKTCSANPFLFSATLLHSVYTAGSNKFNIINDILYQFCQLNFLQNNMK